jgi:hypothetical protein
MKEVHISQVDVLFLERMRVGTDEGTDEGERMRGRAKITN